MKKLILLLIAAPAIGLSQTKTLDIAPGANAYKAHVVDLVDVAEINKWVSYQGFTKVGEESINDVAILKNDSCLEIQKTGLYQFGGCIHFENNTGTGFNDLTLLSRIYDDKNGEARCSQRGVKQTLKASGEGVLSYNGTGYFKAGDCIKLQYYTNNVDLDFYSAAEFDEQVAVTIWLNYLGK